jgi:hypothetical protein
MSRGRWGLLLRPEEGADDGPDDTPGHATADGPDDTSEYATADGTHATLEYAADGTLDGDRAERGEVTQRHSPEWRAAPAGRGRRRREERQAARVLGARETSSAPSTAAAIVLAPADRAGVSGAAVAATLPRTPRAVPVLASWDPRGTTAADGEASSTGAARRGCAAAEACGVTAQAVGRTVRVTLPADDVEAVAALQRLEAAPGLAPVVLVASGAWGTPFLGPIERAGLVYADGAPATVAACEQTLARHGVAVAPVPRPTGPVARALLRAGWLGRATVACRPTGDARGEQARRAGEDGQALMVVLLGLTVALMLAVVLGGVASAMGGREDRQRAIDVAALTAADRMRTDWARRAGSPAALSLDAYRGRAVAAARRAARANGLDAVAVSFPDPERDAAGPLAVRVEAEGSVRVAGVALGTTVRATAELSPPALAVDAPTGDEYQGPLAVRDGKPMRPDVAIAYDRMDRAATKAGHPLTVTSGYRSNAEQARLFAAHPDPKWVARPGTSLHRMGTELDLGPPAAYGWLAANSMRFGFKKRYSWEPWHFGYVRDTGSTHVAEQDRNPDAPAQSGAIPPWVPERFRDTIRAASIRFKVSAALLSAQLRQESGFDPNARSGAGAQGIAQFMPATARAVGLANPFDPDQAIPAQAKLMAAHLRQFGSVPLALAAYNAGPGAVGSCHCVPPFPETRHYVATIIALMKGYDPQGGLADALAIRLIA